MRAARSRRWGDGEVGNRHRTGLSGRCNLLIYNSILLVTPSPPAGFGLFRDPSQFPFEVRRLHEAIPSPAVRGARGPTDGVRLNPKNGVLSRGPWRNFEMAVGCDSRRRQSCLAPLASFGATGRLNGWGPAGPHPEGVLDPRSKTANSKDFSSRPAAALPSRSRFLHRPDVGHRPPRTAIQGQFPYA